MDDSDCQEGSDDRPAAKEETSATGVAAVDHEFRVARGGRPDRTADCDPVAWPVALGGVTETVAATLGPNGRWNLAALGVYAPDEGGRATAKTWGRTRTWRNFRERGGGVVTFVADPRDFVDAALSVREAPGAVLDSADAWAEVSVEARGEENRNGTTVREWALTPVAAAVRRRRPRTISRAFGAVVDATVAASRLGVPDADDETLRRRLRYFADVVERAGGPAEREAFGRIDEYVGWRDSDD